MLEKKAEIIYNDTADVYEFIAQDAHNTKFFNSLKII